MRKVIGRCDMIEEMWYDFVLMPSTSVGASTPAKFEI